MPCLLLSCAKTPPADTSIGQVTISGPDSIQVGQPAALNLTTRQLSSNESIWLISQTGWGTQTMTVTLTSPELTISLPAAWLTRSGDHELRVMCRGQLLARRNLRVLARTPAAPLAVYLGSKSIVADGRHWAMVTAIPTDTLTNPASDQSPVRFRFLRPNGQQQERQAPVRHLVAYQRIDAQTQTGKTIVGVQVGEVKGKEKELLEVPDYPVAFTIGTTTYTPLADGRQTFRIRTSVLADRNGNVVAEGTLVLFRCTDPEGSVRLMKGYTLRGEAEIVVENPPRSGQLLVQASVFGSARSNVLALTFPANLSPIPVHVEPNQLRIGPLAENLGQLLPDGTAVIIRVDDQSVYTTELVSGYALLDRRTIGAGLHQIRISVGGRIRELTLRLP